MTNEEIMAVLQTKFMGMDIKSPLIVSSSGLTGSVRGVCNCVEAGAGAVVLKSMFEELIVAKSRDLDENLLQSEHPEAYEYLRAQLGMQIGPNPYLKFIEDVREHVSVPVIASVNCTTPKWWVSYAKDIELSGADAIELNISHFPRGAGERSEDIERRYADIVHEVTSRISIPVAVKLGYFFTSLWNVLENIVAAGASALVLFNRFYTIDVDIEKRTLVHSMTFSSPQEMSIPLRWTALTAGKLNCDIAASTGVHDSESVIKLLLAGATAVQLCSALYVNGAGYLAEIIEDLDTWLEGQPSANVNTIRGAVLKYDTDSEVLLERLQYLRSLEEAAKYES